MAHERGDTHRRAHREDHDRKENGIRETDGGQVGRRVVPHHDRVEQSHQGRTQLGEHDGERYAQVATVVGQYFTECIVHFLKKRLQNYEKSVILANFQFSIFNFQLFFISLQPILGKKSRYE